jgi:hypothetical protein
MMRLGLALIAALLLAAPAAAAPEPLLADSMESAANWPADASDSVTAKVDVMPAKNGKAVRLSYDFGEVSGYAFLRREVKLGLTPNFEIRFLVRGSGGRNDLQMKMTNGDTVYWRTWSDWRAPAEWTEIVIPAQEVGFAWGPDNKATLKSIDGVEFVIARNRDGGAGTIEIDDLRIVPLSGPRPAAVVSGPTENAQLMALAKKAPRGDFPRAFLDEQPYWTLAGSDGGAVAALLSEDAAIEPAKGSYSVEPAVIADGKRHHWNNVLASHSLTDGYLPIPSVAWAAEGWRLDTTLVADSAGRGVHAGYRLTNTSSVAQKLTLELAIRPWQVNPPAQFLSQRGGYSPIQSIEQRESTLIIRQPQGDGDPVLKRHMSFATRPARIETGTIAGWTGKNAATATLAWDINLAPGEGRLVALATADADEALPDWQAVYDDTQKHWRGVLNQVNITAPPAKQPVIDSARTGLAHMLMSRAGPMLKPGTRSYNRAWIRDGAMMGEGLMRMGRADVARDFADYYGKYLFSNGKVPCCVDFRGADPVPENDSHGQYIFLLTELYRYTGDKPALERDWPKMAAAWRYMDGLRLSERTDKNLTPERRMLYGLMPPSISHEGYSAKPQYSLWDDFWALRGFKDAAEVAALLGKPEAAAMAVARDQFATDLHAAILASRDYWKIDYIPGATSLGDFDATSTTIGLDPGGEQARLDPKMLDATFERYWREFVSRRDGGRQWEDYTPYELRNVSSFVRLGWRDRTQELLTFFFADQRPQGWNGWAEVVGREPRKVRFIGDMPHAWISSDFIRGALDLFAYEDKSESRLILSGGLTADWFTGKGSSISGLVTPYGSLDMAVAGTVKRLSLTIGGSARPQGGFAFDWPFETAPPRARINGRRAAWIKGRLLIPSSTRAIRVEIGR